MKSREQATINTIIRGGLAPKIVGQSPPISKPLVEHICVGCKTVVMNSYAGKKFTCFKCKEKTTAVCDVPKLSTSGSIPANATNSRAPAGLSPAVSRRKSMAALKASAVTAAPRAAGESTTKIANITGSVDVPETWEQLVDVAQGLKVTFGSTPRLPPRPLVVNTNTADAAPLPITTEPSAGLSDAIIPTPVPAYVPSITPLNEAYLVGLPAMKATKCIDPARDSIVARVASPDDNNESAIDFAVFQRCREWTPKEFDVSQLSFVSRKRPDATTDDVYPGDPWELLPRLTVHSHPVLHDHRELLLLQFYLSGQLPIYDLGGSMHRWNHVLQIVKRLNLLGRKFPIRPIHVNSPQSGCPFAPSPVFGSLDDIKYWKRAGHMKKIHPGVFTSCHCVWGRDECTHHVGKVVVAVDSVYYVMDNLPLKKDIHVIAHEYYVPIGALGKTAASAEMAWECRGSEVSVVVGDHQACTYQHHNLNTSVGYVRNNLDEFWAVNTIKSYSPWGTAHKMKYSVWKPIDAMPPLGVKVIEDTFTLTTDMRAGNSALAAVVQTAVTVVDTGRTKVMIPSAALRSLCNRFPGTAREADVHTASTAFVNQCSAIDSRMSEMAIEYLATQHRMRHVYRYNAVWGNRTLIAMQFWWHAFLSCLLFVLFAAWFEGEYIGSWWTFVSCVCLYLIHCTIVSITSDVDSGAMIDAPGSRRDTHIGITRREYGLGPARYICKAYAEVVFQYHVLTSYPGLILDNLNRARNDMGMYAKPRHGETTSAWCFYWATNCCKCFTKCCYAWAAHIERVHSKLFSKKRPEQYQELPTVDPTGPCSLLSVLAKRGWMYDPTKFLQGYVSIVGGDDVSSGTKIPITPKNKDVSLELGYPLTGLDTNTTFGDPRHATFFSAAGVPMWNFTTGERVYVCVPNFGRFLSRSHFSAKQIHPKYVPGRVLDNVKCYRTYFGTVPVFAPLLNMWERVTKSANKSTTFRQHVRSETVSSMYRFVPKPGTDVILPDAYTYQWIVEHYEFKFTIKELLDFERVISECPGPDYVISHHVASVMIQTDTEYTVSSTKTVTYLPLISAVFEDSTAFAFKMMTGYTGAIVNVAIGLIEMALLGGAWFPLIAHVVQAFIGWYAGSALGLFAHLAWNYQWIYPSTGRYTKVTEEQLRAPRVCAPAHPFPAPETLDPTFAMQAKIGKTVVYSIPARMKYRLVKHHKKHCGLDVWLTKKDVIPLRKRKPAIGSWEDFAKYPCSSRTHTAPGAQWLVSSCFANPCVLSGCMRNTVLGALHRRAKPSPEVSPDVEKAWIRYLNEQTAPLIKVLDAAEELRWEPHQQFEWWLNRPGFATEPRKVQLRKAFHEIQNGETIDYKEAKTFCKIQMECSSASPMNEFMPVYEPDMVKGPRPRGVTCVSDHVAVLRGPITQLVAKILGKCFEPGVYQTLPGCIHKTETVWMKGCDPVTMGNVINGLFESLIYSDGTDASAFDKNHTMATRRAVDLAWRYYPQTTKDILANMQYVSKTRMTADVGQMVLTYTQQGGMLSGEPDTSLTNTLVRMAIDRIMHSVAFVGTPAALKWAAARSPQK